MADNINTVENLFLKYEPFTYQEEPSLDDKGVLKKRNQELERYLIFDLLKSWYKFYFSEVGWAKK